MKLVHGAAKSTNVLLLSSGRGLFTELLSRYGDSNTGNHHQRSYT